MTALSTDESLPPYGHMSSVEPRHRDLDIYPIRAERRSLPMMPRRPSGHMNVTLRDNCDVQVDTHSLPTGAR